MKRKSAQELQFIANHKKNPPLYGASDFVPYNQLLDASDEPRETKSKWTSRSAILFAALSGMFFAAGMAIVKNQPDVHSFQLVFFRYAGPTVMSVPCIIYYRESFLFPKQFIPLLTVKSVVILPTSYLLYSSVHKIPVAEAVVLNIASAPIYSTILGRIFLKEPCGRLQIAAIFLMVAGVTLTTKTPLLVARAFDSSTDVNPNLGRHLVGCVEALLSGFGTSVIYICVRKLKEISKWINIFYSSLLTVIIAAAFSLGFDVFAMVKCGWPGIALLLLGGTYFSGAYFMIQALCYENVGPVSIVRAAADIVFIYVLQLLIFNDIPDAYGISGSILACTSIIISSMKNWFSNSHCLKQ